MEFWGAEIKAGEPLKVKVDEGAVIHLSQASLGEGKKGEQVLLQVNVNEQKFVLGTLSSEKFPQISYDLVFDKDFELSHTWKNGSVYVVGYRAETEDSDSETFESEDSEEDVPAIVPAENGKPETKAAKPKASADNVKVAKPDSAAVKNLATPIIDEDESDDNDSDSEDDSDDEDIIGGDDDIESDEEDSSDEEVVPTPKNAKQSQKRPAESAIKTPAAEKKAKLVTPQKSGGDGKKGGNNTHTATPHPSKQAGKNADKSKQQTPKSAGQVTCKSCSKTFNSDGALQSHTKAKHTEAK